MGLSFEQLEAEVLVLPRAERARLAHRLLVSLDPDAAHDLADVEHAWEEEIRRRVTQIDDGTADLIPAEQVFAELRARQPGG